MEEYIDNSINYGVDYADEVAFKKTNREVFKNQRVSQGLMKFVERQKLFQGK